MTQRHKITTLFSSNHSVSSLTTKPGWSMTIKTNYLPPSMKTALSTTLTTTRLSWEESRSPSVTPTDGSSISEGRRIQSEGSTISDGQEGIKSTTTPKKESPTSVSTR